MGPYLAVKRAEADLLRRYLDVLLYLRTRLTPRYQFQIDGLPDNLTALAAARQHIQEIEAELVVLNRMTEGA